jgi:LPXTG-motif cell wall-anchored protein
MRYVAIIAVVAALAVPTAAFAGSNTAKDGYGSTAGNIQGKITAKPKLTTTRSAGTLPFTGQNLAVAAIAGVLLIVAGGTLLRVRREDD